MAALPKDNRQKFNTDTSSGAVDGMTFKVMSCGERVPFYEFKH